LYIVLVLYLKMVFYGDIINSRCYDAIFGRNGLKTPILVLNNEYSNVEDPMLNTAKEVAISDMLAETTYIHPEIVEGD
jgi:hypothetical protein